MLNNKTLFLLVIFFFYRTHSLNEGERYAFFDKALAIVDIPTGKVQIFSKLPSYSFLPTCSIDTSTKTLYTVARNYSQATNPVTVLGINTTTSELTFGNVPIYFACPRILMTSNLKFVVSIDEGYLYQLTDHRLDIVWSFGPYPSNCEITLDEPHYQFWIACPVDGNIVAHNYITKRYRYCPNEYRVQSIAYNPITGTVFGLAPATGNTLIFQVDQQFKWTFMSVVSGYQLVLPPISRFDNQGHLIFIAKSTSSVNIVTVNVDTGSVISQPFVAYPTPMISLC